MTQQRLALRSGRASTPALRRQAAFAHSNQIAAAIITGNPQAFGGPGSLMVEWARRFTERVQADRRAA